MSVWETAKAWWGLGEEPPLTNPASANNDIIENVIIEFQAAAKIMTDAIAELSSSKSEEYDLLDTYRDAVLTAYVALMDGRSSAAQNALEKVVNK